MPIQDEVTFDVLGAAIAVHRHWGPGYLESVYQRSLAVALRKRGRKVLQEVAFPLSYLGEPLGCVYRADLICDDVLVEVKATQGLCTADEAQIIHYLRCSGLRRGLLLNFGLPKLQRRRFVNGWDDRGVPPAPTREDADSAPSA